MPHLRKLMALATCALLSAVGLGDVSPAGWSSLTVDLGYGVYNGVYNSTTGLNVWKGIRYASPPVGNLRWQAPKAPVVNRTAVTADTFGPICPQTIPAVPGAAFIPGNEDCLYLSVYAPPNAHKLPVLVWIHGGGYGYGDGTQDLSSIIDANNKGFIGVAIQYRLGAFGFLSSAEVKSKGVLNAGILDQAFALDWVQTHIAEFGGDPGSVTISGQSAGGGSVMYHALAQGGNPSRIRFQRGIGASPYLISQYNFNASIPTARYYSFSQQSGCGSSGAVFDCLVSKDSMTLQQANFNVTTTAAYGMWAFLPVTDGTYIQGLPSAQLAAKAVNGTGLLVGNNADEGALFVPPNIASETDLIGWLHAEFPQLSDAEITSILAQYPTNYPANGPKFETTGTKAPTANDVSGAAAGQLQRGCNIYAEATFICPSYWLASAFTQPGKKAYHYQYSVPFASHSSDISAYFGPPAPNQGPDFVKAFQQIWGNFITTGNPSISNAVAHGAAANGVVKSPASSWPVWTDGPTAVQLVLNETGGVPYTLTEQWGAVVTQFADPGLQNAISAANAYSWEGGRGARCEFWKSLGPRIAE